MGGVRWLAGEAFSDALRRRIVPVITVLAVLSLLFVDSCTSCAPTVRDAEGQALDLPQLAGYGGMVIIGLLSLWISVLAGVLASDHLAEPLADGSANLLLARPVSRSAYALARLVGAWALAAVTGVVLLLAAALLLETRQGLPAGPALVALGVVVMNAFCVAGLAMALSLTLGRTLTALSVFAVVWGLGAVEALALGGVELGSTLQALATAGPPLLAGAVVPLATWLPADVSFAGHTTSVALRAVAWAALAAAALVAAFRRIELGR